MKNKQIDLNNHLFEQIERLNDEELTGDKLKEEIERSKAIAEISEQIINNMELNYKAVKLANEYGYAQKSELLEITNGEK